MCFLVGDRVGGTEGGMAVRVTVLDHTEVWVVASLRLAVSVVGQPLGQAVGQHTQGQG